MEQLTFVLRRPGMFFGSNHVSSLWAFTNGFRWAEHDLCMSSVASQQLVAFHKWVDERYPFGRGGTWARTFRFLAMSVPDRELTTLKEHLDLFLAGESADAADPTMEKMLASIIAQADPQGRRMKEADFESIREQWALIAAESDMGLWWLANDLRDALGDEPTEAEVRAATLEAVKPLLKSGQLRAVTMFEGGTFKVWPGTVKQQLSRIRAEWELVGTPTIGDVVWFVGER